MHLDGIPFAEHGHGFLLIVAVLVSSTAVLSYLAFTRLRR